MKRFIRYLYEYEQEKRIRNVGFVKVETGNEETIVHMQVKGFHNQEQKLGLYLFYKENDRFVKIFQEERPLVSTGLSWHYKYSVDDIGNPEKYSAICGMLIESNQGRQMAVTWDDSCVDVSLMVDFKPDEAASEQEEKIFEQESQAEEVLSPVIGRREPEEKDPNPDAQEKEDLSPAEEMSGQEETQTYRKKITKITRQDISKLPRCEWKLANNRFLLHGYNNFHHLLLIEEGNYLKLGVPGIYHIKEAECAKTFGFGEFISCEELKDNAEMQEINWENQDDYEIWGYWCKPVRRRRNQ